MKIYRIAKKKEYLTPEEREKIKNRFKDIQCSFAKDEDGYYCYTHRARSKSYPSIADIPESKVDFINSTSSVQKEIKTAQFESFEDVIYSVRDAQEDLIREFYNKKRKKGTMMSWSVIPFARIKKIWDDYARTGVVRDEKGIEEIANKMLHNLARLQAATDLGGHSQGGMGGSEVAEEMGLKPIEGNNEDFYWYFLETKYGTPISDYGLPQLWKLAEQLTSASTAEQKLLLLDQMFNVVHPRGDLAALFIEGGSSNLSQLSGKPEEKEAEEVEGASNIGWYKTSREALNNPGKCKFDEKEIREMINIEKQKPPYPEQEGVIKNLHKRLKILQNIEWKNRKIDNAWDEESTVFSKPLDTYFGKEHPFFNEEINELTYPNIVREESYASSNSTWYKTAVADGEFRDLKDRVNSIKDDIRDIKRDYKDSDSRMKKLEKTIDNLNIGSRMYSDVKSVFTSLQRKIERMEAMSQEWSNYKKEMDDNIKKQVEKHTKARIGDITPKAY